jgi:hypothetical protein
MPKRIARWGNRHPFITVLIAIGIFSSLLAWSQYEQSQRLADASAHEAAARVVDLASEAKARAEQIAASQLDVCERAVRAVTAASKVDDLKLIQYLRDRAIELGRPPGRALDDLERIVNSREAPLAACVPKGP